MPRNPKRSRSHNNHPPRGKAKDGRQQHHLDLEPESPVTREIAKQERVRWGFHAAVVLLVVCGLFALGRATVREAFVKNPRFSLRQVVVNTNGSLTAQKIVRATGLTEGENLLAIDLPQIRERIERLPEVRAATVTRDYEGTLSIQVQQRHPVAWIECAKQKLLPMKSGQGWLLDEEGVLIPCEVLVKAYLRLPVIRTERLTEVAAGTRVNNVEVSAALQLLAAMERQLDDDREEIAVIEIPNAYSLVTKFHDSSAVTFGVDDLDDQLVRHTLIRRQARQQGWQIATLNLLARDNMPVTFRDGAPVAAAANHQ